MKKLICIFASAALFGACEQKTEVVTPSVPSPPAKSETGQKVKPAADSMNALDAASPPATSTETKTESTTTTTTSSPNP